MNFTYDDIRKEAASNAVFLRGVEYQETGCVEKCGYILNSDGSCEIEAEVTGSRQLYTVTVDLLPSGEISYFDCDCPAMRNYTGMCKHCVAALLDARELLIRNGQLAAQKSAPRPAMAKEPSAVRTSYWAGRLLQDYELLDQVQLQPSSSLKGRIRIEPALELDLYRSRCELTMKIGHDRMFVVKNAMELLDLFNEKRLHSYGKSLIFPHSDEMLEEESLRLLAFLRVHRAESLLLSQQLGYYSNKKSFFLSPAAFEEFFQLYEGKTMSCAIHDKRGGRSYGGAEFYPTAFLAENVECKLQVKAVKGQGISITCKDNPTVLFAPNHLYSIGGGSIRCLDEEKSRALRPLLTALLQEDGTLIFTQNDITAFCSSVLPSIKPYVTLSDPEGLLSTYLPEIMSPHIFLDAPSRDRVEAVPAAEYGGDLIDLSTGMPLPFGESEEQQEDSAQEVLDIEGAITGGSTGPKRSPAAAGSHLRDTSAERRFAARLESILPQEPEGSYAAVGDEAIYQLMLDGIERMQAFATVHVSDRLRRYTQKSAYHVNVGVSLESGLLEMNISLDQLSPEELLQALSAYRRRCKYYRLKNGSFLSLDEGELRDVAQLADGLQLSDQQLRDGHIEMPAFRAMYLDGLFGEEGRQLSLRKDGGFKRLVRTIKSSADSDYAVPQALQGTLREYQEAGYRWLKALEECNLCGILADDMGLGKSVQLIALLLSDYAAADKPSLIACPASLVLNWKAELSKFAPSLPTRVIMGTAAAREALIGQIAPGEVVLTSYDLLKRDVEHYRGISFQTFAIDEAQFIKNHATKSAHAVKEIRCVQRFALTGTPIENRLSELWSIFDFLMPGYLFAYNRFRQRFETPIVKDGDESAKAQLRRMIAPFTLRRLKQDVLRELPPKMTTVVPVELEEQQQKLYTAALVTGLQALKAEGLNGQEAPSGESRIKVLALLTRLRQLCCDPSLCFENYDQGSAKLESCMELIAEAKDGGHKVLLFSQFTSMLAILQKRLAQEGVSYYLLQGSTPKEQRLEMADAFNRDDTTVFLISLKAGGTGLNLTGADMVIHYDPWWNLAAQEQATDRAYRIGQTKSLQVYKLIALGTIEEKIMELQKKKGDLASIVDSDGEASFSSLSAQEWMELLEKR